MALSPGETGLLVVFLIFLIIAFVIIYLVIVGFTIGGAFPPGPPPFSGASGPSTASPPGSCNQNMLNDDNNCCLTGNSCSTSTLQFCTNGVCACVTGSTLCPEAGFGGTPACVFLTTSITNCGACGNACSNGRACCNNNCVDILSTSQTGSCGSCSVQCNTGSNPKCCVGFCRDVDNDVLNCGECFAACPTGQKCCTGGCYGDDVNNCAFCGDRCGPNSICQGGTCIPGCPTGFISCSGQCLDPLTDNFNCNRCNNPCPNGSWCQLGSCSPNVCVNTGNMFCVNDTLAGGGCINVQANKDHCGDCTTRCRNGPCVNGLCGCTTNFDCTAGYTCVQSTVQTNTLVASGTAPVVISSPGGAFCMPPPCFTPGTQFCSSTASCTDVNIDPLNCSQCGTICGSGVCNGSGICTCSTTDDCPNGRDCVAGLCLFH